MTIQGNGGKLDSNYIVGFKHHLLTINFIYLVVILAPIFTYLINISPTLFAYLSDQVIFDCKFKTWNCANSYAIKNLYIFGYELLPINGLITIIGLYICSVKSDK